MKPKLIVEQKITPLANQYRVYSVNDEGIRDQLVAFAQQKRLAFKEKVIFYADEQKTEPIFTMRAEKVMDVHGRFLVEDMQEQQIGAFRKDFKKSLVASTWLLLDKEGYPAIKLSESNSFLAVMRRYAGLIPFIGEIIDILMMFFRYHFSIATVASNEAVGEYRKTRLFYDHYELSVADEAYAAQDWRAWVAMAVALDALQSR